jgi:hypothetical protein
MIYTGRKSRLMTIDQYLDESGRTAESLAEEAQITPTSLSRIRRDQQNTTRDVMRRIIAASNGMITAEGLISVDGEAHAGPDTGHPDALSSGNDDKISGGAEWPIAAAGMAA